MIGQSGLPMMNNLAGSKEKAPDEVQAKSVASEAGAFEKVLMPDTSADSQQTLSGSDQASPPGDELTGGRKVTPDLADAAQFVEPQLMSPADGASPTSRDLLQQVAQLNADASNTSQPWDIGDQILPAPIAGGGAEPQVSEAEAQAFDLDAKAESRETLKDDATLLASSPSDRLDAAGVTQAQLKSESKHIGPVQEASKLTSSPNSPEAIAGTKADLPANGVETRSSQQVLLASIVSSPGSGSNNVATTQNNAITDPGLALSKAEIASSVAAIQSPEKKTQSQAELAQLRPTGAQSLSEFRSATASASASSQSGSASTSPNSPSSAVETGELKLAVHSPTPPVLALASETSFLALGSLNERSEVLVGATATVTSTASSRLDAPAAAPPSVDARQVVHQINQAIIRMDGARTEIMLDPVELGRVSLTFITKDEGVTVLINADRSETADLLRRHGEQLQRDLSNAGYEGVELDFGQGDDPQQDPSGAGGFDDTAAVGSTSASYGANFVTSGLDIRI